MCPQKSRFSKSDELRLTLPLLTEASAGQESSVCAAEFDSDGTVDMSTIKPMIDGGTEGLRGHARVIYPGVSPCFECTMWLFPPQIKFPLCTLAETPRSPAHCIEYAHLILWGRIHDEEFDSDNEEHMMWVRAAVSLQYNMFLHACAYSPPMPCSSTTTRCNCTRHF